MLTQTTENSSSKGLKTAQLGRKGQPEVPTEHERPPPFEALLQSEQKKERISVAQLVNEPLQIKGKLSALADEVSRKLHPIEGMRSGDRAPRKIPKAESDALQKQRASLQAWLDESKAVESQTWQIGGDGCWYLKHPDLVPFIDQVPDRVLDGVLDDIRSAAKILMAWQAAAPDDRAPDADAPADQVPTGPRKPADGSERQQKKKGAGGRPRKWADLEPMIGEADAQNPRQSNQKVINKYHQKYSRRDRGTAATVSQVRYYLKRKKQDQ